jgi:uncharacterized damage-inducible protein DinB
MEIKDVIKTGLDLTKRSLDRTLDGLTAEELKWQPKNDANSIGLILFHVIRAEDSMVNRIQGKPQVWEIERWYQKVNKAIDDGGAHYTAEQVHAFVVPDIKDLTAYAVAVRKNTLEFVNGLKPGDYDRKVEMPPRPPQMGPDGKPLPPMKPPFEQVVGAMLFYAVMHIDQHAGEISYIRGLKRGMDK